MLSTARSTLPNRPRTSMYHDREHGLGRVTERQLAILKLVVIGKTNSEIGDILEVKPLTVKNHVQAILRRLGCYNRNGVFAQAVKLGIIDCPCGQSKADPQSKFVHGETVKIPVAVAGLREERITELEVKPVPLDWVKWQDLEICSETFTIRVQKQVVVMHPKLVRLALALLRNPDRCLSRQQLLDMVYGRDCIIEERIIDVYIRRLRVALMPFHYDEYFQTARGLGYVFRPTKREVL